MPSLRIRALIALPLIAAVLFAPTASASSPPPINIGVAPSKLQLRLIPGHTVHTVIKVYNKGTGPVVLDVYPQDYTINAQSTVIFKNPGTLAGSASPWTTISARTLHVPAGAHRAVGVTIDVPRSVPPGTHTLAIIFRSRVASTDSTGVKYQPAVASLLAAGVTAADGTGLVMRGAAVVQSVNVHWKSLTSVRSPGDLWDALFHPTVTAQIAVLNHGNTFFNILRGSSTFGKPLSLGGKGVTVTAPHYTILPGSVRYIYASWPNAPWIGRTDLQTHLFYNDTSALSFPSPHNTWIIPWNLLVILVWVLAVVVIARVLWAKRRKKGDVSDPSRRVVWADQKR